MATPTEPLQRKVRQQRHDIDELYTMLGKTNHLIGRTRKQLKAVVATQHEHGARLDEHTEILDEHTAILNRHSATLNEHTEILNGHSARLERLQSSMDEVLAILRNQSPRG